MESREYDHNLLIELSTDLSSKACLVVRKLMNAHPNKTCNEIYIFIV